MSPNPDPKNLDWQNAALARIDELEAMSKKRGRDWRGAKFSFSVAPWLIALMHRAAAERGISLIGYVQRSIAKQLARDLDMPVRDVLAGAPSPRGYRTDRTGSSTRDFGPDSGEGFGDWEWS